MRFLSRLTLSAALLGSMALPALAQGSHTVVRHRTVRPAAHVHGVAATAASTDAVRTPSATTGASVTAKPGVPAGTAAVTTPAAGATAGVAVPSTVTPAAPRVSAAPAPATAVKPN